MMNCEVVKSPDASRNLNDLNREPFRLPDDKRFEFLHDMADKFKDVDTSKIQYDKSGVFNR